jgi:hypothetical protein
MNFQTSILILSIVLLLVGSIVLSYSIKSSVKSKKWPTNISNCPDYWIDEDGDGIKCRSNGVNANSNLVNCNGIVDFSGSLCDKKNKAIKCKINWDGITYGNNSLNSICNK